jgi:hypothetical protein
MQDVDKVAEKYEIFDVNKHFFEQTFKLCAIGTSATTLNQGRKGRWIGCKKLYLRDNRFTIPATGSTVASFIQEDSKHSYRNNHIHIISTCHVFEL